MKIVFFVCFTVIFLFNGQVKSETLIARIIHNHKKNLSLNYNFDPIQFEKKCLYQGKIHLLKSP